MGRLTQGTTNEPYIFHHNITNKFLNHKIKITMTPAEKLDKQIIDEMLQLEPDKLYTIFGPWLEIVVEDQKSKKREKLKKIWKRRVSYKFKDTDENFETDTMQIYFDPKKIKKYTLNELDNILEWIENETILQTK